MKSSKSLYLGIVFAVVLLIALILVNMNNDFDTSTMPVTTHQNIKTNGFLLPKHLPLADVDFVSTDMSLQSTDEFEKQWTLLALGYTQCPDICPTTLLKLNHVLEGIPQVKQPKVAFLSIDVLPKNIDKLHEYMAYFNKGFVGLSTTKEQLDVFFQSLGAHYSINETETGGLDIEHSSAIFLISPDKKYVANFPYMLTAEQISQDYLAITQ